MSVKFYNKFTVCHWNNCIHNLADSSGLWKGDDCNIGLFWDCKLIFFMEGCKAPADHTRVTVRKSGTLGRLELADVIFPSGEVCGGAILFGTRQEDYGVVGTASLGSELRVKRCSAHRLPHRKDTPHAC